MFAISMPLKHWVVIFFLALIMVFAPFIAIGSFANTLQEPFKTIATIVGCFILVPGLVCYVYFKRMKSSGKGHLLFWVYCAFFWLITFAEASKVFGPEVTFENIIGASISLIVASFMVFIAIKSRTAFKQNMLSLAQSEREDQVSRQAEAILLAEEIKKQQSLNT